MNPDNVTTDKCYLKSNGYEFNASLLNKNGYVGNVKNVKVISEYSTSDQILYFQPCGPVFCPKNADCDQFEDATIWLCKKRTQYGSNLDDFDCDAYGLAEKNVITSFAYPDNPEAGIQMQYIGGDNLEAKVTYECNTDLGNSDLIIDDTVEVRGGVLYLNVQTGAACGNKDPAKRFYLKWPQKGPTPTPTPLQHPQPNLFMGNNTHYVIVDLNDADQKIDQQKFLLASQGKFLSITHFYSPFTESTCPVGYDCKEFANYSAVGWVCWIDEAGNRVCFPDATINNFISISPINNNKYYDYGSTIRYNGAYDVDLQLLIKCDLNASTRDIPLQSAPSYSINGQNGAQEFTFSTSSSMVCPRLYNVPHTPNHNYPTRTPNPDTIKNVKWDVDLEEDGKMIEVDLKRVPSRNVADVALGYGTSYERHTLLWSPIERIPCLENYDCQGFQDSNVWKCFINETNSPVCYPIGNAEYGMTIDLAPNVRGIHADAVVQYKGGINNGRISFFMVCNHSVPSKGIWIDPVGEQHYGSGQSVIVYVHTQHVCYDMHVDDDFNKASLGAIVLSLFSVSIIAYVIIGSLITFTTTGSIAFPNSGFWSEFFENVATGAIFIGTCGKRRSTSNISYDSI